MNLYEQAVAEKQRELLLAEEGFEKERNEEMMRHNNKMKKINKKEILDSVLCLDGQYLVNGERLQVDISEIDKITIVSSENSYYCLITFNNTYVYVQSKPDGFGLALTAPGVLVNVKNQLKKYL